jgi:hypothetical protein
MRCENESAHARSLVPMTSAKPLRKTIEGIPAVRYQVRYNEERAKLRRHYCTIFRFWRMCRYPPCKKARTCRGDAYACLERNERSVPRRVQLDARQHMLETTREKAGPERAARECMPYELLGKAHGK